MRIRMLSFEFLCIHAISVVSEWFENAFGAILVYAEVANTLVEVHQASK